MTGGLDALGFDGRPFDGLAVLEETPVPAPAAPGAASAAGEAPTPGAGPAEHPHPDRGTAVPAGEIAAGEIAGGIVAELRAELLAAHHAAMNVQIRWQERALAALGGVGATPHPAGAGPARQDLPPPPERVPVPGLPAPRAAAERVYRLTGNPPAALLAAVTRELPAARVTLGWDDELPRAGEPVTVRAAGGTALAATVLAGQRTVARVEGSAGPPAGPPPLAVLAVPITFRAEGALEPLAVTPVDRLAPPELEFLAAGRAGVVFGERHDQQAPPLPAGPLRAVTELLPGGPSGAGVLRGPCAPPADVVDVLATGWQAGALLAVWLGLHLCLPEPHVQPTGTWDVELFETGPAPADAEVVAEVTDADLVPRPWLRLDAEIRTGARVLARVRGLTLAVREAPGVPMGTRRGGNPPARPVRRGITGEQAVVDELALATASVGDLTLALGPEFARYTERRATRPPAGGLRLVGRVMEVQGTRGNLSGGATSETEYDSAADAWYYGAAPHPSVPNVVLMETSLQSALLLGYHLGATLVDPDQDYSLRNLDGSAVLHREVDLRGRTVRQRSTLLTTTVLTGAVLQGFRYELWLDGEDRAAVGPFYSGQSLFGFFSATALANQAGLDNGTSVPNWLEERPGLPARVVDVDTGASGPLHLLDRMEVVDGGGRHGAGYLRAVRPVDPADWFFARHFHLDPVMPGSLGVEAVIQALQQWLIDTGATAGLSEPGFVVPAGVELTWRYRGQILAGDGEMTLEVHIREVQRRPGRVRVIADASLWKPGLRIYELTGIAAEASDKGAPPW